MLDAACGTGVHAIALAQRGYNVTGADLSTSMIERARQNAVVAGVTEVWFVVAGFGELGRRVGGRFDTLLCLGNSMPHVLTLEALRATLADFATELRPGGLLFIQNRNWDRVMARRERWMPLRSFRENGESAQEWLFLRFYDFHRDGRLTFNVVTLERDESGTWEQRVEATCLYPWRHAELLEAVVEAEFEDVRCYGDMAGAPYDPETSGNLVLTAKRV